MYLLLLKCRNRASFNTYSLLYFVIIKWLNTVLTEAILCLNVENSKKVKVIEVSVEVFYIYVLVIVCSLIVK